MISRVSPSRMIAKSNATPGQSKSFPKLQDIIVDLSVKNSPKVVRKLKLVSDPYMFIEYTDKKYVENPNNDPSLRGKTVTVAFPDAHLNKKFNRIGHSDPSQCPWKKMGYIGVTQYAQNVFEMQADGTWTVKILKKGKAIFNRIAELIAENYNDETNTDGDGRHFGTRNAPCVRITANATGKQPPLSVEYTVSYDRVPTYITDEMLEMLRQAGEPSVEDLTRERLSYEADAKKDPYMPAWEDFYTYGYPLSKIFKFDPIRSEEETESVQVPYKVVEAQIEPVSNFQLGSSKSQPVVDEDEDDEEEEVEPVLPAKKSAPKKLPAAIFDEDEDDEEDTMPFAKRK